MRAVSHISGVLARSALQDLALYSEVEYTAEQLQEVLYLVFFSGTYDGYCVECKLSSTFRGTSPVTASQIAGMLSGTVGSRPANIPEGIKQIAAQCTRHPHHEQWFAFRFAMKFDRTESPPIYRYRYQKVGQYPSYADRATAEVQKYRPVLGKAGGSEFAKAIGLASHDVGVGAYTYLRRIFEGLLDEAHDQAKLDAAWDEQAYISMRVGERVAALRGHLPDFLIAHPQMYSLLSKGIHEMTEQECLDHFPTLKACIELILDDKLTAIERSKKQAAASAALQRALGATQNSTSKS